MHGRLFCGLWWECVLIKIVIISILSGITVNKDPYVLMKNSDEGEKKRTKRLTSCFFFFIGLIFLGIAYSLGLRGLMGADAFSFMDFALWNSRNLFLV